MKSINIKLHPEKDRDIIEYMKDKPKTWIIKTALREYMGDSEGDKTKNKADAGELFGDL